MPIGIQSVTTTFAPPPVGNGIRIVSNRGTFEITEGTIPQNVFNKPLATVEAWCNDWLATNLIAPPYTAIHIFSLSPFSVAVTTSDDPIVGDWWL